jgi:hypothetical protein
MFYLKLLKKNQFFADREAKQATAMIILAMVLLVVGTEEAIRDFVREPPKF